MGSKSSKAKEKKSKDRHQLRSEDNSSTEPKSQSFQSAHKREKRSEDKTVKRTNEETAKENYKENCLKVFWCNGKVIGDSDANCQRQSYPATVYHEYSSAQLLRRSLPPLPLLSVVSENDCLDQSDGLPKQTSPSAAEDADIEPLNLPNEPMILHHNGLEVVESPVQAIKEGNTIQKKDSIRNSSEGQYASMKTSNENHELGKSYGIVNAESKTLEFRSESQRSTSTGICKIPSNNDMTYMCIDTVQLTDGSANNKPDLMEEMTGINLAEDCINGIQNLVNDKPAQNLTRVTDCDLGDWNKENGAVYDPSSYAEACMMQNELPKKVDTRHAVKPERTVSGHNQMAFGVSAFRTQNSGNTVVEHWNFPNVTATSQIPGFQSQNSFSSSQWLSNNTIKHMRIYMLMKAECETNVTCTVSLRVLIGLAEPNMITKCLEDRIQKHENNNFQKVDSFEVPLLNCNHSSVFTVKVSNIEWLPCVDVVAKDINSGVFEMYRFMNNSVVDPLFWHHLQLPKGLLKEQKFAATISIQQDNCPEKSFKILENLQKVSDLPSVPVVKISQMFEDSVENGRLRGFVKQTNVSRHSIASSFLDLHSDGSAPDNNGLYDEIREKAKQLEHSVETEQCALYLPN